MEFLKNIKLTIGNRYLKRESKSKNELSFINWDDIKRIKLLFIRKNDFIADELSAFARELVQLGKVVDVLIYVPKNKLDEGFKRRKSVEYYCKKDLNWYGKPKREIIENFISTKSDLLIIPVFEDVFHIKWLASMCNVKMIVAPFTESNNWANTLIKLEDENIEQFIQQTVHYLKMINKQ